MKPPADVPVPDGTARGAQGVGADAGGAERTRAPAPGLDAARGSSPRLVFRFAIYTAIGLLFAAAAILLFIRSYATAQAETSVAYHARFLANVALADHVTPEDFEDPVTETRRQALDEVFEKRVLLGDIVRGVLYASDGTVAYASDESLIGTAPADAARVRRLVRGTAIHSEISEAPADQAGATESVLKVFVPVRFDDSSPVGVFVMYQDYAPIARSARQAFIPIAGVLLVVLVALYVSLFPILRRVTRRLRSQLEHIEHQALHDALTGLPNRVLFGDRIELALASARRDGGTVAVMLMDLDRFKEVNDTLGHASGDELLRELGSRLRGLVRESDTIARLGGDEFGVVVPLGGGASLPRVIERLRSAVERPVQLDGVAVEVGGSVGVALFPQDGDDAETLTKHADAAMYVAKAGRSGHAFHDPRRDEDDAGRLALVSELRAALDRGEVGVQFAPKVDLVSGRIESVEALARWVHPERGLLEAAEVVAVAEATGAGARVTERVLEEALRHCAAWDDARLNLRVAVDVDAASLADERFADEVARLLGVHGIEPERLELELSEETLRTDPGRVAATAARLGDLGVQLVLENLGTGVWSLRHAAELRFHEAKVDASLVGAADGASGETIVRSLVELGARLGLRVVATGVDSEEAAQKVAALGCSTAQGAHAGPPLAPDEALALLRKRGKRRRRARKTAADIVSA